MICLQKQGSHAGDKSSNFSNYTKKNKNKLIITPKLVHNKLCTN